MAQSIFRETMTDRSWWPTTDYTQIYQQAVGYQLTSPAVSVTGNLVSKQAG